MVEECWHEAEEAILGGQWDLVVLDEINYAISYKMLDPDKVAEVLRRKPDSRWRKSESMLQDLPKLQSAILASAASCGLQM